MTLNTSSKTLMQLTNPANVHKFVGYMILATIAIMILMPEVANAALPWENPIRQVAGSLCGPVARGFGIVSLVGAGLMIAFGEVKGWIHSMMIVLLGISIAVLAPSFLSIVGVVSDIACS